MLIEAVLAQNTDNLSAEKVLKFSFSRSSHFTPYVLSSLRTVIHT